MQFHHLISSTFPRVFKLEDVRSRFYHTEITSSVPITLLGTLVKMMLNARYYLDTRGVFGPHYYH